MAIQAPLELVPLSLLPQIDFPETPADHVQQVRQHRILLLGTVLDLHSPVASTSTACPATAAQFRVRQEVLQTQRVGGNV